MVKIESALLVSDYIFDNVTVEEQSRKNVSAEKVIL